MRQCTWVVGATSEGVYFHIRLFACVRSSSRVRVGGQGGGLVFDDDEANINGKAEFHYWARI